MSRLAFAALAFTALAWGDRFTFTIASPVAAQDFHFKAAAFVFRTEGCAESAKPEVSATAEGIVKGQRRSVALKVAPSGKPGIYAVFQSWGEGHWVVNLKGACANANAGAIVPLGPKGFIRDSAKFFPRPATDAEIEASLKALSEGGNK